MNLRAAPSNAAEVLAVVEQGDVVRQIGHDRGWLEVEYTSGGAGTVTGWVHSKFLHRVEVPPPGGRGTGSHRRLISSPARLPHRR